MPMNMKKRAIRLAARHHLPVVPMHSVSNGACSCLNSSCERHGKHPNTPHGVKDATVDRSQIDRWWSENPAANIGIATGQQAGILVLDIDPRHRGDKTLKRLARELGPLPDTVTARTGGGGRHLIMKHPQFGVRKDTAGKLLGRGVDVLSDGCIMIAPPSRHASGKRYSWVKGKSFRDLTPAELPEPWLERLRGDMEPNSSSDGSVTKSDRTTEDERNKYLTSIAGAMQRSGASTNAISAALLAENRARCSPTLGESEVEPACQVSN